MPEKLQIFSDKSIEEIEKHLQDSIIAIRALKEYQNKGSLPMVMKEVGEFFQSVDHLQKEVMKAMRSEKSSL